MKKSLLIIALVCGLGWTAQAQLPKRIWGGGIVFGLETEKAGLNFRTYHYLTEKVRMGSELTFYYPYQYEKDAVNYNSQLGEAIVNFHYLVPVSSKVTFYPLAGLDLKLEVLKYNASTVPAGETTTTTFLSGLDIGGGFQFHYTKQTSLFAEYRYTGGDYNRNIPTIGLMVHNL